jgi:hypothetical protein
MAGLGAAELSRQIGCAQQQGENPITGGRDFARGFQSLRAFDYRDESYVGPLSKSRCNNCNLNRGLGLR